MPNYNERTAVFRVESDLDFISGPDTVRIEGEDVVDYPLTVLPKQQGEFSGALVFVACAQAISRSHRYAYHTLYLTSSIMSCVCVYGA